MCGHGLSHHASLKHRTSKQWLFTCQTLSSEGKLCRAAAQSELHFAGVFYFPHWFLCLCKCVCVCLCLLKVGLSGMSSGLLAGRQAGGSFSVALWAYRGWPNTLVPSYLAPTSPWIVYCASVCSYNSALMSVSGTLSSQALCVVSTSKLKSSH